MALSDNTPSTCQRALNNPSRTKPALSSANSDRTFPGSTSASMRRSDKRSNAYSSTTEIASRKYPCPQCLGSRPYPISARPLALSMPKRSQVPSVSPDAARSIAKQTLVPDSIFLIFRRTRSSASCGSVKGANAQYRMNSLSEYIENKTAASEGCSGRSRRRGVDSMWDSICDIRCRGGLK
jgi:hypothetical protein